jgi:hypothetical protein
MIYENNSDLRELLRRGVSRDAVPNLRDELLNARSFVVADTDFAAALAEVKAQHSSHTDAEADARAAYRLLTCNPAQPPIARMSRWQELKRWTVRAVHAAWPWVKFAWAVAVLVLLMAIAARGQEKSSDTPAGHELPALSQPGTVLARLYPAPDVPGSLIIQLQNQGTVLATRPAGMVSFNCTTNMTCSFSGSTFTLTSSGGGGTAHNLLSATHTDTTPATVVRGDLITGQTATPVWQRLALGSNNQVLESNGTDAQWLTLGKAQLPATAVYTDQANTYSAGDQNMAAAASHELPVGAGCTAGATNGRVCFDSTQETPHFGDAVMGDTTGLRVLCSKFSTTDQKTDSVTTEQVFATTCAVPANALLANKQILIHVGFQTITVASPPTLLLKARIEKAGPTDVYFFTQAGAVAPSASTTRDFAYDFTLVGTGAPGAAASIEFDKTDAYNAGNVMNSTSSPITADTTAQQTIQITATWGTAGAGSNKLNVRILRVMVAN